LSNGTRYYYSELTKAEVFRSLRRAQPERQTHEIQEWWAAFAFLLRDYQKAQLDFAIDDEFSRLALEFPIRRNVQDYLHLITAKHKELAFITSDKLDGQIEKLRTNYYQHIYYWPDLRCSVLDDEARRFWNLNGETKPRAQIAG